MLWWKLEVRSRMLDGVERDVSRGQRKEVYMSQTGKFMKKNITIICRLARGSGHCCLKVAFAMVRWWG